MDTEPMDDDYFIEELDSMDMSEAELSQFTETQPLKVVEIRDVCGNDSERNEAFEGALIKKFVRGEGDLPELYTKLEQEEEAEEQEIGDDNELPSTSAQAASQRAAWSRVTKRAGGTTDFKIDGGDDVDMEIADISGRQRMRNTFRKRTVLNAALQGLMGEANLSYARGQIDIAEKICLEIIRQNPFAPGPFFTLAEIYETRDPEKYLNLLTIAAHLNPHDRDQWIRIAEMHIAKGNHARARIYYTKAIKVLPKDYDLRFRKARLLEQMGDTNAAMFAYLKMIPCVPRDRADLCLSTAKSVARHFHALGKPKLALEAMEGAYSACGHSFDVEDLNLYLELLILNKLYARVLSCLRERTFLELETEKESNLELIFFCVIPDDMLPDIRAKLCVSLIHLQAHHLLGYLIQNVHEHIPLVDDHQLDLYIDIAEALIQQHKYAEAIALLHPITDGGMDGTRYCPAFVWLRQAECLRHLNRTNEAIETFWRVIELAPYCYEAKFTLSTLLKQLGRHSEAVRALEQSAEDDGQPLNARLLYERCVMLQHLGDIEQFLEVGYLLLGRQSIKLRNREEMHAAAKGGSFYNAEGLKVIIQMRNITEDSDKALLEYTKHQVENSDLTIEEEYRLFIELVRTAYSQRRFSFIERICFAMVTTKRFVGFHIELERIIILACYFNNDCSTAFSYLRELISKNPSNVSLWNLLSLLEQKGHDLRYHRYTRRIVERHACTRQMLIFVAHYHLHCSSFKYALKIYIPLLKEKQQPLVALCCAVVFNQMSMQRKVLRKAAAIAQSIAFAHRYAELRAGAPIGTKQFASSPACQEIYYNIARIYHQSGMLHLALDYYERALAARHPLIEEHEKYLGLQHEIGYNMHLIYRANGNAPKARQCLYDYCVV